jgi:hypothetical protein
LERHIDVLVELAGAVAHREHELRERMSSFIDELKASYR